MFDEFAGRNEVEQIELIGEHALIVRLPLSPLLLMYTFSMVTIYFPLRYDAHDCLNMYQWMETAGQVWYQALQLEKKVVEPRENCAYSSNSQGYRPAALIKLVPIIAALGGFWPVTSLPFRPLVMTLPPKGLSAFS